MILFVPKPLIFSGAPVAGSGTVTQWTYTVPAGKRSVVTHIFTRGTANAGAVNTGYTMITATIGGVIVRLARLHVSGVASDAVQVYQPFVDLQGADTVIGQSTNNSAVAITMEIMMVVREYQ